MTPGGCKWAFTPESYSMFLLKPLIICGAQEWYPSNDEGWILMESKTLWGEAHKCHVYVRGASPPLTSVYECVLVLMSSKERNRVPY